MARMRRGPMRNPLSCCLWAMAGFLLPALAAAQYSMLDDHPPRFEWRGQIETDFRNEFKAETDAGDRFESWRVGIGGDFGGPINQSMLVGVSAAYSYTSYEFHLDNGPSAPAVYAGNELPRDPWGAINMIDIAPNTTILVGDQFSVVAAVPIRWSAETGARRNAFAAGISAIGRWQITDAKQFFLRLRDDRSAKSRLDDILGSATLATVANHDRPVLDDRSLGDVGDRYLWSRFHDHDQRPLGRRLRVLHQFR